MTSYKLSIKDCVTVSLFVLEVLSQIDFSKVPLTISFRPLPKNLVWSMLIMKNLSSCRIKTK